MQRERDVVWLGGRGLGRFAQPEERGAAPLRDEPVGGLEVGGTAEGEEGGEVVGEEGEGVAERVGVYEEGGGEGEVCVEGAGAVVVGTGWGLGQCDAEGRVEACGAVEVGVEG